MVDIRRLGPDDWQELREIRLASLAADPSAFGSTLQQEQALTVDVWRAYLDSAAYFLALLDGSPVGVTWIRPLAQESSDAEINGMWVVPEHRGAGIGMALLLANLAAGRAAGYRSVRLWVASGNLGAASLYEKAGFVPTGVTRPLPSDPQLTLVEYVLAVV